MKTLSKTNLLMQNLCKTSDFSFLFLLILTLFTHYPIRPFFHSDEKNHSPSQNPNTPKPPLTVKRLKTLQHSESSSKEPYQAPSSNDNEIVIEFLKKMKRLKSSEAENDNAGRSCLIERGSSEHEIVSRACSK